MQVPWVVQTLREGVGGEAVNSRWTRYGNDFPLASLLSHTAEPYRFKKNTSKSGKITHLKAPI